MRYRYSLWLLCFFQLSVPIFSFRFLGYQDFLDEEVRKVFYESCTGSPAETAWTSEEHTVIFGVFAISIDDLPADMTQLCGNVADDECEIYVCKIDGMAWPVESFRFVISDVESLSSGTCPDNYNVVTFGANLCAC